MRNATGENALLAIWTVLIRIGGPGTPMLGGQEAIDGLLRQARGFMADEIIWVYGPRSAPHLTRSIGFDAGDTSGYHVDLSRSGTDPVFGPLLLVEKLIVKTVSIIVVAHLGGQFDLATWRCIA